MILEEYLEIKPNGKAFQHYKDLGYDVHRNVPIMIKNEDVADGSRVEERIFCDCCKKTVTRTHNAIVATRKAFGMDLCPECAKEKPKRKLKRLILRNMVWNIQCSLKKLKKKLKLLVENIMELIIAFKIKI